MEYKYPKISNCLIYKKCDINSVEVIDYLTDESYLMGIEEVRYIRKLDGQTHPYDIQTCMTKKEIDSLIEDLDNHGLLRKSNKIHISGGTVLRTVWEPKWTALLRLVAFLCNNVLLLSWLPVLIIGILMFRDSSMFIEFDMAWLGIVIGLVVGTILHEFGHAFAGVSYGARVFEMGILIMNYTVPGAYVLVCQENVKNRLKRIQINAAGVEMNILVAGVFLIFSATFEEIGGIFFTAAIQNISLAALNLTLIKGLDGTAIISELLGVEDVVEKAAHVIFSRKKKRKIKESGLSGRATVATCYMICAFQLAFPLLFILNVMEVIAWFV